MRRGAFPPPVEHVRRKIYAHDLRSLVTGAGHDAEFEQELAGDPTFEGYWATAKEWNESARYLVAGRPLARDLIEAIENETSGVMRWIKIHW